MIQDTAYLAGAKEVASASFEIALHNVLLAIRGLKPETAARQIAVQEEANSIRWIIAHLAQQLERHFLRWCQGTSILADEAMRPYQFGASKPAVKDAPMAFRDAAEYYLKVADAAHRFLRDLPPEGLRRVPEGRVGSGRANPHTILELVERNTLHLLGHAGQIFMIRRLLGDYGSGTFVMGMTPEEREKGRQEWDAWWGANRAFRASEPESTAARSSSAKVGSSARRST
jgi:hypothetical protein